MLRQKDMITSETKKQISNLLKFTASYEMNKN